ncbi:DUF1150 family protein [Parasedimentitalea maritima]|uniref:DUF1150 family protein n=2 Tax=Parasedimentitalea TaxID=2738399 RepID=A0A6L6WJ54_9RHOB|nr:MULTISPECIES: DUF1150 family protein [Zongyanglinia]KAE9627390.1 DUF1150 family protein [Zongyanglinia marina]MVO17520.1 DUF1150 family protein [Zongyanglinia huanghaiensis]TLP58439.1 DUF1150 family protein [Zongyanglinia marina]
MQATTEQTEFEPRMAYVKTVDVADLPAEVQEGAKGRTQLYAVHDAEGEQLALVADRHMAFVLARQNDYAPVPVH